MLLEVAFGSRRVAVENRATFPPLSIPTTNLQRGGVKPLSGKPYYHVVLSKSHVSPPYVMGPSAKLYSKLPSQVVPTVLKYGGKSWKMTYNGQSTDRKRFTCKGWGKFVEDNCLKVGDACIFELMEKSTEEKVIFQVQILRGDLPFKFHEIGESAENPIVF
ncbi:DNA-binding barrel domain superfamily [Sesbania bispinosa]|nr:DNA-binding barrel domain superfamily [Sesbania bispinosa]